MTQTRGLRRLVLGFWVLLCGTAGVFAHAVPGSRLVFHDDGGTLAIELRFALEDLVIAAPDLAMLEGMPVDQPLSAELQARLAAYISAHFAVQQGGKVMPLTLTKARIEADFHDHIGQYRVVVSQWQTSAMANSAAKVLLDYDAVMHEVRNHRARIDWRDAEGQLHPIAEFGFNGTTKAVPLRRPKVD